jgi:hypothetical protein
MSVYVFERLPKPDELVVCFSRHRNGKTVRIVLFETEYYEANEFEWSQLKTGKFTPDDLGMLPLDEGEV